MSGFLSSGLARSLKDGEVGERLSRPEKKILEPDQKCADSAERVLKMGAAALDAAHFRREVRA
jgi:hypothetical protein